MRTIFSQNKDALYGKLLAAISLCISLTLLVSVMTYYTYFTGIEKNRAFHSDLSNLKQSSRELINFNEVSQTLSFQLYRNTLITNLIYYSKPDIYDVTLATLELRNYLNSMPFIDSVYVYNSSTQMFYVASNRGDDGVYDKSTLSDKDILNRMDHYKDIQPFVPIPRVIQNNKEGIVPVFTFLAFDAVNQEEIIDSAVIVNISASWIRKDFSELEATSYILDNQGRLLSSRDLVERPMSDPSEVSLIDKIKDKSENYFVEDFEGISSLISFTSPDSLGWQYIRITPYEEITKETKSIRNTAMLIAFSILAIGLFVSRALSKQLYQPIGKIVNEMKLLENEKRDNMFTLRQNALRDLIVLGAQPNLRRLGIPLQLETGYRLIVFRIDHFQEIRAERGHAMAPYKFAIMNIASEIFGPTYQVEGVDMNDDSVLLLLNAHTNTQLLDDAQLEIFLHDCREACLEYIKIGISGAYSPLEHEESRLHSSYLTVREAAQYRFFRGYGSMISSTSISELTRDHYNYPSELEKKLVEAVANGKSGEASACFSEIIDSTKALNIHSSQLALSRLTVTIKSVIDTISRRSSLSLDGLTEMPDYMEYETAEELQEAFSQWFDEIGERLADKRSNKQSELIRRIQEKVHSSFKDPNLNLTMLADELDMSPVYISRLYKQQTMSTIMDYVMQVRLEEVCRLLEQTDLSVALIAEQTGFTSSSYLHRMFKRHFNITPIEYRRSAHL